MIWHWKVLGGLFAEENSLVLKLRRILAFLLRSLKGINQEDANFPVRLAVENYGDLNYKNIKFNDASDEPLEKGNYIKITIEDQGYGMSDEKLYKIFNEGEWLAITEDPEWGGQGMPRTVASAAAEYFNGANFPGAPISK